MKVADGRVDGAKKGPIPTFQSLFSWMKVADSLRGRRTNSFLLGFNPCSLG